MNHKPLIMATLVPLAALGVLFAGTTSTNIAHPGSPGDRQALAALRLTPSATPPTATSTQEGEIWYDSAGAAIRVWDGDEWATLGGGGPSVVSIPIGSICPFGATTPPAGWLACDGSSVAVADYSALHGVIGYTWGGSGDNFTLPDLRGRTVIGRGQGAGLTDRALAATGGEEGHSLSVAELAAHVHCTTHASSVTHNNPTKTRLAEPNTGQSSTVGSGDAHNTMAPFAVLTWMIRYQE